jgi:uncharacterized protein (TIGR03435 family)
MRPVYPPSDDLDGARVASILDATSFSRGITRWAVAAIVALGIPLAYVVAAAQERVTFEAASVKPATSPPGINVVGGAITAPRGTDLSRYRNTGGPGSDDPGRIHYPLVSLTDLLKRAYEGYFDIKAPEWADTDIMAVDAIMSPATTKAQFQKMLQNLLINRFALKTHVDTKEITGYALTVAKDGPKFKESLPDNEPQGANTHEIGSDGWPVPPAHMKGIGFQSMPNERVRLFGPHATMAELAKVLGGLVDSTVEDATRLKAEYNITVTFAGHFAMPGGVRPLLQPLQPSDDPSALEPLPDNFSALRSELGLKLEKRKVSVEILVVDHLEKVPVAN